MLISISLKILTFNQNLNRISVRSSQVTEGKMNSYRLKELKVEVSRNCPLHCIHCSSNGSPDANDNLDPKIILSLVNEFAYMGGEKLCLSGGEPLCYAGLDSLIRTCNQENIHTVLYTSGVTNNNGSVSYLSERTADILAENDVKVIFSLHGATDTVHDRVTRVPGSFRATIHAIERTLNVRVEVEVHFVPLLINFFEIPDLVKLVSSYNIDRLSLLRFVPQGRGSYYQDILRLPKERLIQLIDMKAAAQQAYPATEIRTGSP